MIDHASICVSNYQTAKEFYSKALSPLGYSVSMDVPEIKAAGFGVNGKPDFWISEKETIGTVHVALGVESRSVVDGFYEAALKAGGKDNGAPGLRTHYHPHYYGAFVYDADGNNIEVVCHKPE
jgi:catechol 2,3-dioxygenase-like lactoylglutathione lyase family enzyme